MIGVVGVDGIANFYVVSWGILKVPSSGPMSKDNDDDIGYWVVRKSANTVLVLL